MQTKEYDISNTLDIEFNKRFIPNIVSNIIYFVLNLIVGLALVPFFLDSLGESAYGLIPLATSLTSYVTLFIDATNEAIARYFTINIQKNDVKNATITHNTAIFGTLTILLLLLPLAFLISWLSPTIFDIGDAVPTDVIWLFILIIASVFIRAWSSNFMVILFSYNRLDLRNTVNNINLIVQVLVVILLFYLIKPSLPLVGLSYFIASVTALVVAMILSKRVCPFLHLSISTISLRHMKEILSTALWVAVTKLGVILRSQVALIIVNIIFGTIAGTEYSLILTWNSLLYSIIGLVTSCITPKIYSCRARDDKNTIEKIISFAIRNLTFLAALLVSLICIFAGQLMTIWVGDEYAKLAPLMWVTLIQVMFVVQSLCCAPINAAYVCVRGLALANIAAGIANVVLAVVLPLTLPLGIYGVALATSIITFILTAFFSPMYGAYILHLSPSTFIKPALPGYLALVILLVTGFLLTQFITVSGIVQTFMAGGIIALIYCTVLWYIVFKKKDRELILTLIPAAIITRLPEWLKHI